MPVGEITKLDQITPQKSTKTEDAFTPTPHMLKVWDAAVELGYTASITKIMKKAGADRKNWYLWRRNPDFVEWWDREWQMHIKLSRWRLDAIGLKKAEKEYEYWHDMQERTGNINHQNIQNNQFNFVWKKEDRG